MVTVTSGSTVSDAVVLSGGTVDVISGGTATDASVLSGGWMMVSGGVASGTALSRGGEETVFTGGSGVDEVISAGAVETLLDGAGATGAVVAGGSMMLLSGAVASGTQVVQGTLTVSRGFAFATTIGSGGALVFSAGVSEGDVVSGGQETIRFNFAVSGAQDFLVSGSTIEAGGTQTLVSGSAFGTVLGSGGVQLVSGGTTSHTVISSGGFQLVAAGAIAINDILAGGGSIVDSGQLVFGEPAGSTTRLTLPVTGNGDIVQYGGGTLLLDLEVGTSFSGSEFAGALSISGGTAALVDATGAGSATIGFAAAASGTLAIDGAVMPTNIISGLMSGDAIDLAGVPFVAGGSVTVAANKVTISVGGTAYALAIAGATADGTFHLAQGADGSTLLTDTVTDILVRSGVTARVSSGRTSSGYVVLSGGTLAVLSGGTVVNDAILSGGVAVLSGGRASASTVSSGATETILARGVGVGEIVSVAGRETVSSGGTTSGNIISGGIETLLSGAIASATLVKLGTLAVAGGRASATTVAAGGFVLVSSGATVGDIVSGGLETLRPGLGLTALPAASGGLIEAGGTQALLAGIASGATIGSGGIQYVAGGTASATTVSSGGIQVVTSGNIAANDSVVAGGVVSVTGELLFTDAPGSVVTLGGRITGNGVILQAGGGTLALSANVGALFPDSPFFDPGFTGALSIASGTVLLTSAAAVGAGSIGFAGGHQAVLKIAGIAMPANTIAGFLSGDIINLTGVPFSSGATATASGNAVTVSVGGLSYVLTIANAASDGTFRVTAATDGTTVLTDTAVDTVVSSGVTSTLSSGVTASAFVVLSGGTLDVLTGGTAIQATVLGGGTMLLAGGTGSGTVLSSGAVETVFAGGSGVGEVVSAGAVELLSSGGRSLGTVLSGGTEALLSGAVASSGVVAAGALVVNGGTAIATTVASGGFLTVSAGSTSGDVISGGVEIVRDFFAGPGQGVVSGSLVESGGVQNLYRGTAIGATIGGGGIQNVQGGATSATFVGSGGSQFVDAGNVATDDVVVSGGIVSAVGDLLFDPAPGQVASLGGRLVGSGAILESGGGTLVLAASVAPGFTDSGFTGALSIAGGTVELTSAGAAGSGDIGFAAGSTGTLAIDGTTPLANTIAGLLTGDVIDLGGMAYSVSATVTLTADNVLDLVMPPPPGTALQLDPTQNFSGVFFHLSRAAAGAGTLISDDGTPCYCPGTLIRTDRGDVPVEDLAIGDRVVTCAGEASPIRWLGRRAYPGRFAQARRDILPICITAGALGGGLPRRDLFVSPQHAMLLGGDLVPAGRLVNGASIHRLENPRSVEYIHIELARHDVIWAEGAASETYRDEANRFMFHNAPSYFLRYPDPPPPGPPYPALRLESGYRLDALRRRLARRAGFAGRADGSGLRGRLDAARADRVSGWAQDPGQPETAVCLDIMVDARFTARALANRYRADLAEAGLGSGYHAFDVGLPGGARAPPRVIEVRRASDGMPVDNSPWWLDPGAAA